MSQSHDAPKGRKHREPLYDKDIPTPTHAERARTLVANVGSATLCTLAREPKGHPYGSFVVYGMDGEKPVFLVSHLAEHTRNMLIDDRVSLLVAEDGTGDALARGRVTLVGRMAQLEGAEVDSARTAYLAANPGASYYIDFRDFSLWGLTVESVRFIGGYGRMLWVESTDWAGGEPDPMAAVQSKIVSHMNDDHQEAMSLMCRAFTKAREFSEVTMTGLDRYGFEMSVKTDEGSRPIRLAFDATVATGKEAREQLVAMTKKARVQLNTAH